MNHELSRPVAIRVFVVFAMVYLLSTLVRAITATLAPELTEAFDLTAANLGLLAGSYFIGFCLMQIPLGICLDRFGPPRTAVAFLVVALVGGVVTATAQSFTTMLAGRVLLGLGLAAGLMAPLAAYRRWYSPAVQMRANSWMLMVGSLGMLMSTLPVQWLLPLYGWRGVFWVWTGVGAAALVGLLLWLPRWQSLAAVAAAEGDVAATPGAGARAQGVFAGFGTVVCNRRFISVVPLGFFVYGGMFALLTLWVGPWLSDVAGLSPQGVASGLFGINVAMMLGFLLLGGMAGVFARMGLRLESVVFWTVGVSLVVLPLVVWQGRNAGWVLWALYCLSVMGFSLVLPKLAQYFPSTLAGRALTVFNLAIFSGTFFMQWGIGMAIDAFRGAGFSTVEAYQCAMLLLWACHVAAFGWFLRFRLRAEAPAAAAALSPLR